MRSQAVWHASVFISYAASNAENIGDADLQEFAGNFREVLDSNNKKQTTKKKGRIQLCQHVYLRTSVSSL
jgi:hypothetical protein